MPLLPLLALALIQGVCELLPLSAASHLIVLPRVLGWPVIPPLLAAAGDLGVSLALALHFRRELWRLAKGAVRLLRGGRATLDSQLFFNLLIATVPAGLAQIFLGEAAGAALRSLTLIAAVNLGVGLVLLVVDRLGMTIRRIVHMTAGDALLLGLAQLLAFLPGAGRGAVVMAAARLLGYERGEAARFALLMGLPTILGAGLWSLVELHRTGALRWEGAAGVAGALAGAAALLAIPLLLAWLRRGSLAPFALYRLLFGGALLGWLLHLR